MDEQKTPQVPPTEPTPAPTPNPSVPPMPAEGPAVPTEISNPPSNPMPLNEPTGLAAHPQRMWIGLGVLVVVLLAGAAAAFMLKKSVPVPITPSPAPTPQPSPNPSVLPSGVKFEETTRGAEVKATVDWRYPTKTSLPDLFPDLALMDQFTFSEAGTFKDGPYKGSTVYIVMGPCECLGGYTTMRMAKVNAGSKPYVILLKNSDPLDSFGFYSDSSLPPFDPAKVLVDTNIILVDLTAPPSLTGPKPGQFLTFDKQGSYTASFETFNATNLKAVFNDPKLGQVYTTPDDANQVDAAFRGNGFYVKGPDWNTWTYDYQPSIIPLDNTGLAAAQVTWNGGVKNAAQYNYVDIGGCGSKNYASIYSASEISISKDLVKTGSTASGDPVYEFKDKNNKILKDIYENEYTSFNGPKMTYDQFVTKHPVFFWVDPFGRLMKFTNIDFQTQAECGKPVIYLYPTRTENVNVQLHPTGGFSYTEPTYNSGWNVTAEPNGQLTNSDGKTYPYLFWEGRSSGIYQIPEKGFVVAASDVHNFLNEKLAKLGLNGKETADFEEYWQPYFHGAPYYFITFMGNSTMDKIAPLAVNPKPDTVIRILMDFKPLDKPMAVQGYDIKTPIRSGFTVVEWGGVKP